MGSFESHDVGEMEQRSTKTPHAVAPTNEIKTTNTDVSAFDRWMANKMLLAVGKPPLSVQLWDGSRYSATNQTEFTLTINDRNALWSLLYDPEFHFGELYSSSRVMVTGELVPFLEMIYCSLRDAGRRHPFYEMLSRIRHRPRFNSLAGSRENISHHYNLSNEFYELWLDREAMQYTCAYFPEPTMTIEQAQVAKLHHVCRKLQLKPGDSVVEAGCGWGGLARFMAKHYGVKVKAYNISTEQIAFARARAKAMGLDGQVEYVEDDYRNINGKFDVFVSVGMLEHVGKEHYETLGQVVARSLKDDGRGLIHSIGRNRPGLMNAWIEKRIFPGAYPPSLKEMMDIFEPNELSVLDVENLRLHYAKTLEHWLQRFDENEATVRGMFDENFVRAWRLYLAGSIAAFTTSELQLFQIVFSRAYNNRLPWSRAHLYTHD